MIMNIRRAISKKTFRLSVLTAALLAVPCGLRADVFSIWPFGRGAAGGNDAAELSAESAEDTLATLLDATQFWSEKVTVNGQNLTMKVSMSDASMCSAFSALTGIPVDYCLRLTRANLAQLGKIVPGTYVKISEDISFMDPKYEDFEPEAGEPYPDDYFVTISSKGGKVYLNEKINGRTNLEWLLDYNPSGDEDTEYNAYYAMIAKALIRQFFEQEGALKNTGTLTSVIRGKQTNLTANDISTNLDIIFGGGFRKSDITYPGNWERAVETLRKLDGRKE